MQNSFKENIKIQLIASAREYFKMLDKMIVVGSDDFENRKKYTLKFSKTNYLHLTGVISQLKPEEFFNRCFDGIISVDDFDYNKIKNKSNIKTKLRCLVYISSVFCDEVLVQEDFVKNKIFCKLATTNSTCTIGFTGGERSLWPRTILNKNRLDESRPIYTVKPIILKNK